MILSTAVVFCVLQYVTSGASELSSACDSDECVTHGQGSMLEAGHEPGRELAAEAGEIVGHGHHRYRLQTRLHSVGESLTTLTATTFAAGSEAIDSPVALQSRRAVEWYGSVHHDSASSITLASGSGRSVQAARRRSYRAHDQLGRGANGEVWRAGRVDSFGVEVPGHDYVLKRVFSGRTMAITAARREVYFGSLRAVMASQHCSEFVEWFARSRDGRTWDAHTAYEMSEGSEPRELWLVFRHAGQSLHQLMFILQQAQAQEDAAQDGSAYATALLVPSPFWTQLQLDSAGHAVLREMMAQMLMGLADLHDAGILHRDVKPSNVLFESVKQRVRVRLADFGSAVLFPGLNGADASLYPDGEPSIAEETLEYAPPEVRLGSDPAFDTARPHSYDIFSAGLMMVELLLGQPASELMAVTSRHEARIRSMLCRGSAGECHVDDATLQRAVLAYGYGCLCVGPADAAAVADSNGCAAAAWSHDDTKPCDAHEFKRRMRAWMARARERAQRLHAERGGRSEGVHADAFQAQRTAVQHRQDMRNSAIISSTMSPDAEALVARGMVSDDFATALVVPRRIAADLFSLPAPPWAEYSIVFRSHAVMPMHQLVAGGDSSRTDVSRAVASPDARIDSDTQSAVDDDDAQLVPDDALNLLYRMLSWEPAERPRARQLLQSRYFQNRRVSG